MKYKIVIILLTLMLFSGSLQHKTVYAQMMSSPPTESINQTQRDESEGKTIYEDLKSYKTSCDKLKDTDFEALGEYFMGQSIGNTQNHAKMNDMMKSMMSEQGEEQMHIAMGKRLSGCDINAVLPSNGNRFIPMFDSQGGGNFMMGIGNGMMGALWGYNNIFGWLFMLLISTLIIVGIIFLIRYLATPSKRKTSTKNTPLQILKERYAKGEIDKEKYEDMQKDLG